MRADRWGGEVDDVRSMRDHRLQQLDMRPAVDSPAQIDSPEPREPGYYPTEEADTVRLEVHAQVGESL